MIRGEKRLMSSATMMADIAGEKAQVIQPSNVFGPAMSIRKTAEVWDGWKYLASIKGDDARLERLGRAFQNLQTLYFPADT